MGDGQPPAAGEDELEFDKADFENKPDPAKEETQSQADIHCGVCKVGLSDEYYTANDQAVCRACQQKLAHELASGGGGSFMGALFWGLLGAIAGAGLYYGVSAISGYEIGLVAIVVGILVGKGVRRGAGTLDHWAYRAMGIGMTYVAIVSTYMPTVVEGMTGAATAAIGATESIGAGEGMSGSEIETAMAGTGPVAIGTFGYLVAFMLCLVAPALMVAEGEIMWLIILAIGLWEGYKFSAPPRIALAGPFQINAADSSASSNS